MTNVMMKIKKLIALAKDQEGTAEAESAMLKAQEFLLKNNLSMDSIESLEIEEEKEVAEELFQDKNKSIPAWKKLLARIIGANFRVEVLSQRLNGITNILLIGLTEDVAITKELIKFAWNIAEREATKFIKSNKDTDEYAKYKRYGNHKAYSFAIKNDFHQGFREGLKTKFAEQVKEKALIIVKDALVINRIDSMKIRKVSCRPNTMNNENAINAGFRAGKNLQKDVFIE